MLVSYKETRPRVSSKHSVSSTSETLGASDSTQVCIILVSENSSPILVVCSMEEDESESGSTSASAVSPTGADRSPMYIDAGVGRLENYVAWKG